MLRKHRYVLLIFVATFGLCYLCLILINPLRKPERVRLVSAVKQTSRPNLLHERSLDPAHPVTRLLTEAIKLQDQGRSDEAETIYKKILADETLLESHDPMRVIVLQSYAKLLVRLGRTEEANLIIQRSKEIPVRRKIDKHPDRAHIS